MLFDNSKRRYEKYLKLQIVTLFIFKKKAFNFVFLNSVLNAAQTLIKRF